MIASPRLKWLGLALLASVQFMVVLDIAIVNVALPSIQVDLSFSQENLQWVISAYALVFGGFLLLGGRMADLLGRRRIFLLGIVVFTLGSLVSGLAWSEASLIGARGLQGHVVAVALPGGRHDHHAPHPGQIHLEEHRFLADRIRLLGLLGAAGWPGAIRRVGGPEMHLRVDDVHTELPSRHTARGGGRSQSTTHRAREG